MGRSVALSMTVVDLPGDTKESICSRFRQSMSGLGARCYTWLLSEPLPGRASQSGHLAGHT